MMATKATKGLIATLLLSAALLTGVGEAIAKGSYSRPSFSSSSSYSRPSISAPSRSSSSSSGYSRPSLSAPRASAPTAAPSRPAPSFGDRQINRSISGSALREFRERRDMEVSRPSVSIPRPSAPTPRVAAPSSAPSAPNANSSGFGWSRPSAPSAPPSPPTPQAPSWSNPPAPYATTTRSYGSDGNGWLLWWLLANQQHSSSAAWMAAHRDDTAVKAWRAEAEEMARNNADLREKLDALDRRVAGLAPSEIATAKLPEDVSTALSITRPLAQTRDQTTSDQAGLGLIGSLFVLAILVAIVLVISSLIGRKKPMRSSTAPLFRTPAPAAPPKPRFLPGHVVELEYSQFLLADGLKVTAPKDLSASRQALSVTTVGELGRGKFRLHVGDEAFIETTISTDGTVAEARYFSLLDEVTPESPDEWGLWMNPQDGLIGFPVFETKDGVRYDRVWASGETQAAPIAIMERTTSADHSERQISHEAMLYARDTGLQAPAPQSEFLLVSTTEEGFGSAYVRLWAGIDIPTSSIRSTKA